MNILNFPTDLLLYILSFSENNLNLVLTCKKFYNLSLGNVGKNRRGWIGYTLSENMYRKGLYHSIHLNYQNLLEKILQDITKFTNINLNFLHHDTINLCILYNRFSLLKVLVEKYKIDPSYPKSIYFQKACKLGKLEIVKYLAKNPRIDVDTENVLCHSSLALASEHGHLRVVKFLVEETAMNVDDTVEYAVYVANLNKHTDVVNYLSTWLSYSP